jgi:tRNA 2-thiouridine synthesizing protein E
MNISTSHTRTPQLDEDGFLTDPQLWDEDLARKLARADGLPELNEHHIEVIRYLREHYLRHGTIPAMQHVCWVTEQGPRCIEELFHTCREAWRIAGLPNPGEEAKSYM